MSDARQDGDGVKSRTAPSTVEVCGISHDQDADSRKAPIVGSLCGFEHPREPGEAELAWLAERQHWCLHRRQLLAAGVGRSGIAGRVRRRQLHPLLSDVYLYGRRKPDPLSLAMATVLHLRGDAVISDGYAAWIWEISDERPHEVIATLVGRSTDAPPGVILHRAQRLDPKDVRRRKGLPVTAPARSLIDLARTATALQAESALAMLRRKQLATEVEIEQALDRVPDNHPGKPVIRELMARPPGDLAATKSIYERKLRRLLKLANLPAPISNHVVAGKERDLVWLGHKLIVEFDGYDVHRAKFRDDRAREAAAVAAGWRVIRLTADRVDSDPYAVIAEIAAALAVSVARAA